MKGLLISHIELNNGINLAASTNEVCPFTTIATMGTAQQQKTAVLEREFEFTQQKKQNISVCSAIQIQMFLIKAKLEKHL